MSGPGASRALVMKKLPPMVAERKLSRPVASNGASPSAAQKNRLDPADLRSAARGQIALLSFAPLRIRSPTMRDAASETSPSASNR